MSQKRVHSSSTSIMSKDPVVYYLLNENDALFEINKTINEVKQILGLQSSTVVRILLNHFHWDQNTLNDRYWEDPERLLAKLKILPSPSTDSRISPEKKIEENSFDGRRRKLRLITCQTCCVDIPSDGFYALACGHQHCLTCWRCYLRSVIESSRSVQIIHCPSRCNEMIDDEKIYKLLIDHQPLLRRYEKILVNEYVESNQLAKWCPGVSCNTIIIMESSLGGDAQMITCDRCQTTFCFKCLSPWHDPIQCTLLQKWHKKNRDESMNSQWLMANTKECPKCQSSIEKNGGCNHMTCRKPGCTFEFCWLCLGSWHEHQTRQCNVYRPTETERNKAKARESLDRYLHYFTRYENHQKSLEFENKLVEEVEQRRREMQVECMSLTDQNALDKAATVLKECRYTLKYTYAFAYYLYQNNQAEVFQQNQADLERATEALSAFLEHEISPETNVSSKLMDRISYCSKRREILLDHCKEGYSEHYWAGLDPY